jgi:hypothetical protein
MNCSGMQVVCELYLCQVRVESHHGGVFELGDMLLYWKEVTETQDALLTLANNK